MSMLLAAALLANAPATSAASRGPDAAVAVVRRYYALLGRRRYADAYRLWGDGGRASGLGHAAFRRGFAHTAATAVTIGRVGAVEGAAGSSYVSVPVTVAARLDDGTRQRFAGRYVLRRINDVPGSSAADRHWHIASAKLKPVP